MSSNLTSCIGALGGMPVIKLSFFLVLHSVSRLHHVYQLMYRVAYDRLINMLFI
jgi:hypothetical protein